MTRPQLPSRYIVRIMTADHSPAHQIHSINSQTARRHPRSAAAAWAAVVLDNHEARYVAVNL